MSLDTLPYDEDNNEVALKPYYPFWATNDDIAMSEWCETVESNYWSNQSRGLCIERLKVED